MHATLYSHSFAFTSRPKFNAAVYVHHQQLPSACEIACSRWSLVSIGGLAALLCYGSSCFASAWPQKADYQRKAIFFSPFRKIHPHAHSALGSHTLRRTVSAGFIRWVRLHLFVLTWNEWFVRSQISKYGINSCFRLVDAIDENISAKGLSFRLMEFVMAIFQSNRNHTISNVFSFFFFFFCLFHSSFNTDDNVVAYIVRHLKYFMTLD